jgi:hypothetical protein
MLTNGMSDLIDTFMFQLSDAKKKADEVPLEQLEEIKRKAQKDLEVCQKQLEEAEAARERAERSKKKLQQEVWFIVIIIVSNNIVNCF